MLMSVAQPSSCDGLKFWAVAFTVKLLSDWGVDTSIWFHGCQCLDHESDKARKACKLKGRRSINLACGQWKILISNLQNITLDSVAMVALTKLESIPDGETFKDFVERCFNDCRDKMVLRAQQAWSFWGALPYSLLELDRHLVDPTVTEDWSRARALQLMADFDLSESKTTLGSVSWIFFQQHRGSLCAWARDGKPLEDRLRHLVLGFSTGLNVMQRLEARHHLVNLALARGRALSVPGVISGLRRRFNQDLQQQSFREELPQLLNDFDQLVLQPWDSQRQLLEIIYGHGLDQLHPSTTWEDQQLQRIADLSAQPVTSAPSRTVA